MLSRLSAGRHCLRKRAWTIPRRLSSMEAVETGACATQEVVRALSPGDKLHGYTVKKVSEVPELFMTTVSLQHDKTGAEHLHVARNDDNNTFSVLFRTTPMDSTGVPHILEHTVLCGSKRFPVRDPFFKMLNRSLATFMNAMTASDWTMYPFATQNRKDYNNLMSVYLDACFYPELRELDFRQEGWRLEHSDLKDKSSPINFKGVVYNEMKGVFSSQNNIFCEAVQNQLLPNHTYGVVSGGDPAYIPDLTWDQLRDFHRTHYHPSNARFCTYGNFPLEDHLEYINNNYLQHFDKIAVDTEVPTQPRWTQPRESRITCHPDTMAPDPEKQTTVAVNFLLADITDLTESTTLSIISALLTDGETSPFYQALLEANIGSDYSPVIGYNGYTRESTFSVGLQGIHKDDVEKVKTIISETIDKVISEGFEPSRIEAILHRIELGVKHQSAHFGLGVVMSSASGWNHGADASEMLRVNRLVADFKQQMEEDPKFLQKKVKQYLKDNPHRLTLVMSPDDKYEEARKKREEEKLADCVGNLTDADKAHIFKLGQDLQASQNATEDLSCLPCIQLGEIDRKIRSEPTEHDVLGGCPVQFSAQPTNEVMYLSMLSFLDQVPEEMKVYVPLFASVITKMGAGIYDYKELSHQVELYTGGLGASPHINPDPRDPLGFDQSVRFSSYCLERNVDRMLDLWTEIFDRVTLNDKDRLMTLIRMSAAELAAGLPGQGHGYAMGHAAASLTPASKMSELFGGISQVSVMKKIAESDDNSKVLEHLVEISQEVLNKNNLKLCVNATPGFMPTALQKVENFVDSLKSDLKPGQKAKDIHTVHAGRFTPSPTNTHIELPFTVNYMSKGVQTVPYCHSDYPALRVLSQLLTWKFLHREIREKGGAYGGGAKCGGGVFSFYSYRDPNSMETLSVFDRSVAWAAEGDFTDKDVEEAKISVFKQIDTPIAPGSVGKTLFQTNITDKMRQTNRDGLFGVSKQSLLDCVNRYLVPGAKPSSLSFLGPANKTVADDPDWKVLKE